MRPPFFVIYFALYRQVRPQFFCGFPQKSDIFCTWVARCGALFADFCKSAIYFAPALATEAAFFRLFSNKNKIIFCACIGKCARNFSADGFSVFCAVCCNVLSQLFAGYFTESVLTLSAAYCNPQFF